MSTYDHKRVEKKWQEKWEKEKAFHAIDGKGEKNYLLIEFPYPSGDGLHVGHVRSWTALDVVARKRRTEGKNVLYPIGWDAFGLPTENYAIKTGKNPRVVTKENTDNFRRQIKSIGLSFDWEREVNTTDPKYYKWTQWIFLEMFKKGLAYKAKTLVNWCPKDKIVLANEEVVDGCCERCGTPVEKREKEQWMLAITKYAKRLYDDLDTVDYIERAKVQQKNWIGSSEGAEIEFAVAGSGKKKEASPISSASLGSEDQSSLRSLSSTIKIFTTRPDTIFGATYMVLAPEHPLVQELSQNAENKKEIEEYVAEARKKSDIERTALGKEKTGVDIKGVKAINPATKEEIPIFIADYVLASYGTGAIMAVPAHDMRDMEFAKKFELPTRQVVAPYVVGVGGNAPRSEKDIVKFRAATVIIKHWSEDKYYVVEFSPTHRGLVGGHVEEGETIADTARHETIEESGYKDIASIEQIIEYSFGRGYKERKQREEICIDSCFLVTLASGERIDIVDKETKQGGWKTAEEILSDEGFALPHKNFFQRYLDNKPFTDAGKLVNSGSFDELDSEEAKQKITESVGGKWVTTYKLRDWVFSRQRYWGEPIPMVYCERDGWVPVPEDQLPVTLPEVEKYQPTDTGESPLANITEWVNTTCPTCDGPAKRETDVMPNWAGSSWYYLRYADPSNDKEFAAQDKLKYWTPVDWYNGGMEHTVLHLLYSRFWHKFLFDIGVVPTSEPYMKRTSHGLILAEGGEKMSKSKGNTVSPDTIVENYGADSLRLYEMFIGPFDQPVAWSTSAIAGTYRFLERVWRLGEQFSKSAGSGEMNGSPTPSPADITSQLETLLHQTIKKVTEDIEHLKMNTAVSALMILLNEFEKKGISKEAYKIFLQLLAPFAPHIASELWEEMGSNDSIYTAPWPTYDAGKIASATVTLAVQINGKARATVELSKDTSKENALARARENAIVAKWLTGVREVQAIYVPGKIINFVVDKV